MTLRAAFVTAFLLANFATPALAHRDGCHAQHSCPTEHGTYECGDKGHCSQCPDNAFCKDREPRKEPSPAADSPPDAAPKEKTKKK